MNAEEVREHARSSEDFDDWWGKYSRSTNPKAYALFLSMSRFFHGLGLLLRKRLIDISLLGEFMPSTILNTWKDMGFVVKGEQTKWEPWIWEHFEFLHDEVKAYREK